MPDTGPQSFARRLALALAWFAAWGALLGLALWTLGRVLSDRFHWTQYLAWIPSLPMGAGVLAALGISRLFAWRSGAARRARAIGWLGVLALAAYSGLIEWHALRPVPSNLAAPAFRVVYWNRSTSGEVGWEYPALEHEPDLVVVRAGTCTKPEGLARRMSGSFCWDLGFQVATRAPIRAWGVGALRVEQGLGLDPREPDLVRKGRDPGRAMWLLLDAHAKLGRDLVVWLVDMPSDLSLWRDRAMAQAAQALRAGPERVYVSDELGRWVEAPEWKIPRSAFSRPDLIVGDFNTPHGSHSIRHAVGDFASAFDQAGRGYGATFPARWPLWMLDQAYVAPELHATHFEVSAALDGTHRMIEFGVAPAPTSTKTH